MRRSRAPAKKGGAPEGLDPAYSSDLDGCRPLGADEERRVALLARGGCAASREALIRSHLRFVVWVAGRYAKRGRKFGPSIDDLVAAGNAALIRAADGYDPDLGRFSTYAHDRVRKAMHDEIRRFSGPSSLTDPMWAARRRYREFVRRMSEAGRTPTIEDVVREVGVSRRKAIVMSNLDRLDRAATVDEEFQRITCPGADVDRALEVSDELAKAFSCLTSREADAFRSRYGDGLKLREIAEARSVTRQRIEQITSGAARKMREFLNGAR